MTTILSSQVAHDVHLDITISESLWLGLYDRIELWRSVLGEEGPYEEITGKDYTPARVPMNAGEPIVGNGPNVNIENKTLKVLVNETTIEFTILGPDPRTFAQVAAQVTTDGHGLVRAFVAEGGVFVLETGAAGGQARLEVLSSDAAALLGLPLVAPDSIGFGKDIRLPLISGKEVYTFRDYYGKKTYFYKIRFRNSLSGAVSEYSGPTPAVTKAGVSDQNMVTGFVTLVRRDGQPDVRQEVIVYTPPLGYQIEGKTVNGGQDVFLTDDNGHMEVRLIRGVTIDLSIGGQNLMRRIVVPTDPEIESFDLLAPEFGVDDTFAVKRLNIPAAEKVNL